MFNILQKMAKKLGKKFENISIDDMLSKKLKLSDLQWLFMYLFEELSKKQNTSTILNRHADNRFTQASNVDPLKINSLDRTAFTVTRDDFKPVILSPVSVLGSSSSLTEIKQGNIM